MAFACIATAAAGENTPFGVPSAPPGTWKGPEKVAGSSDNLGFFLACCFCSSLSRSFCSFFSCLIRWSSSSCSGFLGLFLRGFLVDDPPLSSLLLKVCPVPETACNKDCMVNVSTSFGDSLEAEAGRFFELFLVDDDPPPVVDPLDPPLPAFCPDDEDHSSDGDEEDDDFLFFPLSSFLPVLIRDALLLPLALLPPLLLTPPAPAEP